MIQVEHLTKVYGNTLAVDDISFEVGEGEIVGFLGPNGAGKSTTMRMLTCFMPPTSGKARVAGHDCFLESLEVRRNIGYLPENVPLYPEMRVTEYLNYRAKLKDVPWRERKKRVEGCMEQCGISDVARKQIGHLSKGYRQRVGLADALVGDPKILILDEPTIGLDPNQIREVRALIQRLGQEHTVLLSTHILPEVEIICGRVLIIHQGRIIADESMERLRDRVISKGAVTIEMRAGAEALAVLENVPGVASVASETLADGFTRFHVQMKEGQDCRTALSEQIASHNWPIRELHLERATLEEIFVKLTSERREDN